MRGLAFPPNAPVDREPSYEYGTPISNVDDIPIDPALGGAAIDPALMMEHHPINVVQLNAPEPPALPENPYLHHQPPPPDDYQIRQYSEGPQGDPFAPQIHSPYFPIEEQPPPPPPKPKRKRKYLREEECSFCQENETKNKAGEPEIMVTCSECGRSGHPSCMALEGLGDVVRSYPWKCLECKNCEVCKEKGDDARILFCDWCDRGWHMDCVEPPFQDPPEGKWHCPICPPILPEDQEPHLNPGPPFLDQPQDTQHTPAADREPSVASSSRPFAEVQTPAPPAKGKRGRKSTGRPRKRAPKAAVISDGSDNDDPMDVEATTPVTVSSRARVRGATTTTAKKGKSRAATTVSSDGVVPAPAPRGLKRKRPRESSPPPPTTVRLRIPAQRGRKGKAREEEEGPRGMFDDILTPEERNTSHTTPLNMDKVMFERSRQIAESKLAPPPPAPPPTSSSHDPTETETPIRTRPLRSSTLQQQQQHLQALDFNFMHLNSPGPSTPGGGASSSSYAFQAAKFEPGVLRIRTIRFGPYDIKTWYDAPFPEEYASIPDGRLWICEFCLKYMKSRFKAVRHQMKCKSRHPPGDEIYRDGSLSIFEVDGRRNKIYCQNLCLLSKMFLDHKSLFYDVEPFLFYVITVVDEFGARFVGYFSKEKRCPKDYNLSCIMTLPVRQRQGWGNFLIDFSYLLSKIEQRQGSPEKPLSSLGALGYKNYWTLAIMRFLEKAPDKVTLEDITSATSMTVEDVCNTLMQQNMIFIREATPPVVRPSPGQSIKFPRGRKNGVARRQLQRMQSSHVWSDSASNSPTPNGNGNKEQDKGPFVAPKQYEIRFERDKVEEYLRKWESKGYMRLKAEKLQWTPYLVTRSTQEAPKVDLPAMDTVREDEVVDIGVNGTTSSVVVSEPPTEPVTPMGNGNEMMEESPAPHEQDDDVIAMAVDGFVEEGRTRKRSSARSPTKKGPRKRSGLKALRVDSSSGSPPAAVGRSLRTRSSHVNLPSPNIVVEEPIVSIGSGRQTTQRQAGKKMEDEDEELAAKLGEEEEEIRVGRRQPRGESQTQENKRPAKGIPGRKRRRIESSPEVEEVPLVVVDSNKVNGDMEMVVDSQRVETETMAVDSMVNGHQATHQIETPETMAEMTPPEEDKWSSVPTTGTGTVPVPEEVKWEGETDADGEYELDDM